MKISLPLIRRLVFASCLLPLAAFAQRMDLTDKKAEPVFVESVSIATEVTGRIAVTTFDLVFRNPNGRNLEGTFVFPLLDGQNVVRFALDINGKLREAVPVDKDKGRIVFEEIERRRVDPGLLEKTEGNNYRARVFPIPANGTRHIVIAYQEDIVRGTDKPSYRLNLDFKDALKDFHLDVTVFTGETTPPAASTSLNLELPSWRESRFLEVEKHDFKARGVFELNLPTMEHPSVITGIREGKEYFYAEVPVTATRTQRPVPKVIGILWDSSSSGRERDHEREFDLLDAWFQRVKNVEVRLIRLRNTAEKPMLFPIANGNWSKLREELENTTYDGATALDGLEDNAQIDEWLLFSDGLFNYGTRIGAEKLPVQKPVHFVLASARANSTWMRGMAERNGGEFVNLLETKTKNAVTALRTESLRIQKIDAKSDAVAHVFPEIGASVSDGVFIISGILRRPEATLRLKVGPSPEAARDVEIMIRSSQNRSAVAARAWALEKLNYLSLNAAANRDDIRRTSRDFGIVTDSTSLIVLETIEDYLRYEITPPEELRPEWTSRQSRITSDRKTAQSQQIERIVAAYNERVAWWGKTFPKDTQKAEPADKMPERPTPDQTGTLYGSAAGLSAPPMAEDARERLVREEQSRRSQTDVVTLSEFRIASGEREGRAQRPAPAAARGAGNDDLVGDTSQATISLQRWQPKAGYLNHLNRSTEAKTYGVYLEERGDNANQPGFYLDAANFFFDKKQPELALRILSNLAELGLEDAALLRVLAHRLMQADRPDQAVPLFERVLILRPEEPQSRRDLALACAAVKQYQRAIDLLWEIVSQPWDERFPDIELIALAELNAIVATCDTSLDLSKIDSRLRKNLPVGTRVILTWDANDCDIDLWVTDPNGEKAMYNHPLTYQGGRMSRDFTGGYGPEEFILRDPKAGMYNVEINYYGDRRQSALGPVTAQVRLITHFGTKDQKEERITVRLSENKEVLKIGSFGIGQPSKK
ncbi:MAG: VIT domain-containing protein [Nibricoccus sp.]